MEFKNGIFVESINLDGPAKNTDLQKGDIITKIDGVEINKMCELRRYIYTKDPNDTVKLTVQRNRDNMEVEVKLGKK